MNFKLIVAIVLVVLLLGGGIFETKYVEKTLEKLDEKVGAILAQGDTYDRESIEELIEWWKNKSKTLSFSLPHNPINEVAASMNELLGTVIAKDFKSATACLTKIKGQGENIKDSYTFSPKHIM